MENAHGINPRIIPFGAAGLYFADRVCSRIHWRQARERINKSLAHYLSNCLKLPRHYAKVRGSPVTPGGRKHVSLQIPAIINPSSVWEKDNWFWNVFNRWYIFVKFRKRFLFLSLRFLSRKLLICKINSTF